MKFLLTADWHIRDDQPKCRTDNFMYAQEDAVRFVIETAVEQGVTAILLAGDVFNKARPIQSQMLEIALKDWVEDRDVPILCVPGNHDLPYHRMEELNRSSLGTLFAYGLMNNIHVVPGNWHEPEIPHEVGIVGAGWGTDLNDVIPKDVYPTVSDSKVIGVTHTMVYQGKKDQYPGAVQAEKYLKDHSYFDLIVTGDNHVPFVVEIGDRKLVNPGALTMQSVDSSEPRIYVYDSEKNSLEEIMLPIEEGVISRDHLDFRKERDEKISAFVESMKDEYNVGLSFEKNLEHHIAENPVEKETETLIWQSVE